MDAKTRLAKLMRISDPTKLSDEELAIEYETELANIDSYRKWLTFLHEEWHRESIAEKQAADPLMTEDGQTYNPAVFSIEKMGLSKKATSALMQMGIETFGDFEDVDPQVLEAIAAIGHRNVEVIERILTAYGLPVFKMKDADEDKQPPMPEKKQDETILEKDGSEAEVGVTETSVEEITDAVTSISEKVIAEEEHALYEDLEDFEEEEIDEEEIDIDDGDDAEEL